VGASRLGENVKENRQGKRLEKEKKGETARANQKKSGLQDRGPNVKTRKNVKETKGTGSKKEFGYGPNA